MVRILDMARSIPYYGWWPRRPLNRLILEVAPPGATRSVAVRLPARRHLGLMGGTDVAFRPGDAGRSSP